jgi:quercetin dioxygenase-like cupin family protein
LRGDRRREAGQILARARRGPLRAPRSRRVPANAPGLQLRLAATLAFPMDLWDLQRRDWRPHRPEILSSAQDARAITLDLPAGEMLQDHQVHEGAWIMVIRGEVTINSETGQTVEAQAGMLLHLAPQERHEVRAREDARLLLLLTPWPGPGHPGTMTLKEKTDVRARAAERAG